jgi:hypothetical protein
MYFLFKLVNNGDRIILGKLDEAVHVDTQDPEDTRHEHCTA